MSSRGQSNSKRKDKNRIVLRTGESQRSNGTYAYRWTDPDGERKTVYAKTLDELRAKEANIAKCLDDGIRTDGGSITVDELYNLWIKTKTGIRHRTKTTYINNYRAYIQPYLKNIKIAQMKKSDFLTFFNRLSNERHLKITTMNNISQVLSQIFEFAVDDKIIRESLVKKCYKEFKQQNKQKPLQKKGLTFQQQEMWLKFLKHNPKYKNVYPMMVVMTGTGMRIGEISALRWDDIDFEEEYIYVNHSLSYSPVYFGEEKTEYKYSVNDTKTISSERKIKMLDAVKEALLLERETQISTGRRCTATIDGFSNFVFFDSKFNVCGEAYVNRKIKKTVADFNARAKMLSEETGECYPELPHITCHTLRHTFTNRMCEAGVNLKLMQSVLGHSDITTTLNIYADVTDDLIDDNFDELQLYLDSRQAVNK